MYRTLTLSALAVAFVFGAAVMANEKPTPEFQTVMKSNGSVGQALKTHTSAKDYDAIAADAATLKANYTKIEAFWTQKKVDDAIAFAKTGLKGATDLEAAAKAKDDAAIATTSAAITGTCGGCHTAHRERLADMTFEIK